jgi:hypothetical protein
MSKLIEDAKKERTLFVEEQNRLKRKKLTDLVVKAFGEKYIDEYTFEGNNLLIKGTDYCFSYSQRGQFDLKHKNGTYCALYLIEPDCNTNLIYLDEMIEKLEKEMQSDI